MDRTLFTKPISFMRTIKTFILAHKVATSILLILVIGIGYWEYGNLTNTTGEARYVTAAVTKGSIITSVSGTGQVSASNQVELKAKASGDVSYISAVSGQTVGAGAVIAQLNTVDAQKAIRDAQVNLDSAKLSLDKLQKPADQLSILQAENALEQAKQSKQNAQDDLAKAYDDGFNTVANAFLDLPTVMTGLDDTFYDSTIDRSMPNITWYINQTSVQIEGQRDKALQYQNDFNNGYNASRTAYNKNFEDYKAASRSSDTQTIEALILQTYETTRTIADTVKTGNNLIDFVKDSLTQNNANASIPTLVATHKATLNTYTGTTNSHLSNLLSIKTTIQTSKDTIINSDRTIAEKTESLAKLKAGTDALDIESQQLTIRQRENALLDAKEKLADYYIRAPFAGTIAAVNIKQSDSISSGTSIATLITKQKIAEITLNEVDVAKVKSGQKATLTFDAVDGLSISGVVAEINTIGTVTQGVVSYTVKIGFDTQDDRIKPGMSVSAAIITDMKQDVLTVPNSAIKTQGTEHYVELFDTPLPTATSSQGTPSAVAPRQQVVETGLSNDTMTEITFGLKEGEQIVARTITSTTKTTQTAPSLLQGAGGGATRGIGR